MPMPQFSAEAKTLMDIIHDTIHNDPNHTTLSIAQTLGCSQGHLSNALSTGLRSPGQTAVPRLDWLIPLIRKTGNFRPLDYIESALGRVAFRLPEVDETVDEILLLEAQLGQEVGDVFRVLNESRSPASPGGFNLTRQERKRCVREVQEVVTVLNGLLSHLDRIDEEEEGAAPVVAPA